MKIRVVHFSDWHGLWEELPPGDIYTCTGDMYPNSRGHKTDWLREEKFQRKFAEDNPIVIPGGKPVYGVRGNHDHIALMYLFLGGTSVIEFGGNVIGMETITFGEKKITIGGFRGVKRVHGRGPDEMAFEDFESRVKNYDKEPNILLTHGAPYGVLDDEGSELTGSPALLDWIQRKQPLLHCFGHIHEAKGIRTVGKTIVSNAATGYNVIELSI